MVSKRQGIIAVVIVIVLVAAGMVVVLGSNNKGKTNSGPEYVIDAMDRNVTANVTPLRVVSASPTITELVYALGAGNKLVGVTDYCDFPADVVARRANNSLASIGGFYTPNFEKIVNATPDLVLLDSSVQKDKDMMPQLDTFGIRYVVMFEGTNSTMVYKNIEMAGVILKENVNSAALISTMQSRFASISTSIGAQTSKPKVMVTVYYDETNTWINGGQTFIDDIVTGAGGVNAFSDVNGFANVNREAALAANPDYIIIAATMNSQSPQEVYDMMMNDTLLKNTKAVLDHHVYVIINQCENSFLHEGIREVQAAQILAEIMYPSTFGTVIPHIISDDYLDYLPASWNANTTAAHVVMGSGSW
jgi:iron complex transport system substrate-binding protein